MSLAKQYNYHRTYDPSTGRYLESDPIGLNGGLNTYGYVFQRPTGLIDPFGLDVNVCFYPQGAKGLGHIGYGLDTETRLNGDPKTWGLYPTGNPISSQGKVKEDVREEQECTTIETDDEQDECLRVCRIFGIADPGTYQLFGKQCSTYVRDCLQICGVHDSEYEGPLPRNLFNELKYVAPSGGEEK